MKRSTRIRKLVVSRETVRAIAHVDLVRPVGGDVPVSGQNVCVAVVGMAVSEFPPGACTTA